MSGMVELTAANLASFCGEYVQTSKSGEVVRYSVDNLSIDNVHFGLVGRQSYPWDKAKDRERYMLYDVSAYGQSLRRDSFAVMTSDASEQVVNEWGYPGKYVRKLESDEMEQIRVDSVARRVFTHFDSTSDDSLSTPDLWSITSWKARPSITWTELGSYAWWCVTGRV